MTKLRSLRQNAYQKQNCICFYCRFPMWEDDEAAFVISSGIRPTLAKYLRCTAEHLVAQTDGGRDTEGNIVAACLWCNSRRHLKRSKTAPSPEKYQPQVARLVAQGKWHPVAESGFAPQPGARMVRGSKQSAVPSHP